MKWTTTPPVQVEPEFRRDLESALREGETIAMLVHEALRREVVRRREHAEFIRRGLVAIRRTVEAGDGIPANIVISKLRAKVSEARKKGA